VSESQVGLEIESAGARRPLAVVADDEAEVRQLVGDALVEAGFETLSARDGLELLELATRHCPELIVADVMMPKMDGYTAIARLRGQPLTAAIPIIMLTGCTDPAYGELSEGMGAAAHLTKPFSPVLLGELAQAMVRRARV
jgi:CheY-like chemotaxis protein